MAAGLPALALPPNRPIIAAAAATHIGASGATTLGGFTDDMRTKKPKRVALPSLFFHPGKKKEPPSGQLPDGGS